MVAASKKIGVLALQGSFREHLAAIARLGGEVEGVDVRTPADLVGLDALILPGGESTAIAVGLEDAALLGPVRTFCETKPVWGICAGLILLADELDDATGQTLIGGLGITVKRNAFGRQIDSRFRSITLSEEAPKTLGTRGYFIRAPAISAMKEGVIVLASVPDKGAVAVRANTKFATCFHPEISSDDTWLRYFVSDVCGIKLSSESAPLPPANAAAPWAPAPSVGATPDVAVKRAFAVFQQGGVIMDVVNADQARIAEAAGAVSVMALERIPADIKADGGVARSSDPKMIKDVMNAISLPVMAKARIGHFYEGRVLEALAVDCIDESEVLTAADETNHIDKRSFDIPFVCGAQDLGEALRRIAEGAAMIRLKGNAGTGNVMNAVRHARAVFSQIRRLQSMRDDEIFVYAKETRVSVELVEQVRLAGRLPVVTFAAGGLATPADVAMLMDLGVDGVFVGSGIFKGENPAKRARAMVAACTHFRSPTIVARVSEGLGKAMVGLLEHEDPMLVARQRAAVARQHANAAEPAWKKQKLNGKEVDFYVPDPNEEGTPNGHAAAIPFGGIDPAVHQ